jgi:aspartate/methionine/tyrosine aminotransferase
MFSSRTRWDLTPNRLADLLARKRAEGVRLLDLTESNPTRAGIPYPADLLAPLARDVARRYEPQPFGLPAAREAAAADFARRGHPVAAARVMLTASTSEAYAFLFKLLADPGDDVLVPRPGYPLFDFLAALESVAVRPYELRHEGGWHLDVVALEALVGPRTRAIVVVNPNNPTGAFLHADEIGPLQELCARHSLALVSDEVFADFAFRETAERVGSVAADGPCLAFAMGGLSKSCGLPQLKLAWTAVCGPRALREDALARLEMVADTYLSVSTPVQVAAPELLARRAELQRPIAERVRANLALVRGRVAGSPATLLEPEGGWYAVLRVPATLSEEERVLRLLDERDVLIHPGYFFDFPHEAFLVASLLTPPSGLAEGLDRVLADLVQ